MEFNTLEKDVAIGNCLFLFFVGTQQVCVGSGIWLKIHVTDCTTAVGCVLCKRFITPDAEPAAPFVQTIHIGHWELGGAL